MIGHVASAHEASGRVVLRFTSGAGAADAAFEAAARIAEAFQSEIEGLFVEERQLVDLTAYGFVKETSLTGTMTRPISVAEIEREFRSACHGMRQRLERLGRQIDTRVITTITRDDPLPALARTCAAAGPWNVVVLGEPFRARSGLMLGEILASVRDATGLVTVGPRSMRTKGPVVAAIENTDRMSGIVRTAERLASANGGRNGGVIALLIADDFHHLSWLETQARLAFSGGQPPQFFAAPPTRGEPGVAAEAIRQLKAGFVVAQFGGMAVPYDDLSPLSTALECPLFLLR